MDERARRYQARAGWAGFWIGAAGATIVAGLYRPTWTPTLSVLVALAVGGACAVIAEIGARAVLLSRRARS